MSIDLKNQSIFVTGAASGIGLATAELLVAQGARVAICDLRPERVSAAVEPLGKIAGAQVLGLAGDLRSADDCQRLVDQTIERFGQIDALVHCAGILRPSGVRPRPLVEVDDEEYELVVGTNLKGTFLINRAVLRHLVARKAGQIINLASTSGRKARPLDSVYSASKAGVISLSESIAEEVRGLGIRVQVVLPDAIDTPLWQQNGPVPPPPGALPPVRVAEVILMALSLPLDTTGEQWVVSPLSARRMRGKPAG